MAFTPMHCLQQRTKTDILGLKQFHIALNVTDPGKELWLTEFGFDRIPYSTARDDRVVGELEDLIDALELLPMIT